MAQLDEYTFRYMQINGLISVKEWLNAEGEVAKAFTEATEEGEEKEKEETIT